MNGIVKKTASVAMAALMSVTALGTVCSAVDEKTLSFGDDGKFTVLQIADTQDDQYPAFELSGFITLALEQSNPDLVVFTGDNVEDSRIGDIGIDAQNGREGVNVTKLGKDDHEATLANAITAVDAVFKIVNDAGIPFAITQGNNDYNSGVSNAEWLEIYSKYENCLVTDESDDADGKIDYDIALYSSDGSEQLFNFYMMDVKGSDVTDGQLAWYERESAALTQRNGGDAIPAFVFQHVPVAEVGNLFEECKPFDEGAYISGTKFYRLGENASGYYGNVQLPGQTSREFESWKKMGDVIGAYFGHYHNDGYTGEYDGIELGLTYGAEFAKLGPYGVRVITLDENDISNYENDLYVYSCGSFEKQDNEGYTERGSRLLMLMEYIKSIFYNLINIF